MSKGRAVSKKAAARRRRNAGRAAGLVTVHYKTAAAGRKVYYFYVFGPEFKPTDRDSWLAPMTIDGRVCAGAALATPETFAALPGAVRTFRTTRAALRITTEGR